MNFDEYYDFRRSVTEKIKQDLIGPLSEDEIIQDAPITQYISGALYPRHAGTIAPEQDVDEPEDADEAANADPPVSLANVRYPSSMGMTFSVDSSITAEIDVFITAGRYEEVVFDSDSHSTAGRWQRRQITAEPIRIEVNQPYSKPYSVQPAASSRLEDTVGLELYVRVRAADPNGAVPVTLVLLNRRKTEPGTLRDADSFFQVQIEATAPGAQLGTFVERSFSKGGVTDKDLRSYSLLYRNALEFGVGHGCSVEWTLAPDNPKRAIRLSTTYVPKYDLPLADSNPQLNSNAMGLTYLVQEERSLIIRDLYEFCDGYRSWIESRSKDANDLEESLHEIAIEHLAECAEAAERMRAGVKLLAQNDKAWTAFVYANQVMLEQRSRSDWLRGGKQTKAPLHSDSQRWRPFQLAFILLCLPSIADPQSPDRKIADLLWFPTGGGKTEAYLGLIAFTVFLRRLNNKDGGGVTALMRYTLRLLTIQQFERASLLMCCMESVRNRNTPLLGSQPISIGLWVGQGATPNSLADARAALNKLRNNSELNEGNPCQLQTCPWCGHDLDHRNYWIAKNEPRLVVSCRQEGCEFKEGLPVYLVDDDIYNFRPTLIIATADKFAGLPWREQTAELFNLRTSLNPLQLPPELIIQDELHLISGPLGTLAGLYETAVDGLASRGSVGPKVIASTATIRRATEQMAALFDRRARQFPPPGIEASDSYFAVEAPRESKGTRLYMGVMAPGTSHTSLLVRSYASLLQNVADLAAPDHIKDPYWTLVGYFNSLRVLGGARMQVQDDVNDRILLLANRSNTEPRPTDELIELTSREPSANIPSHLRRMSVPLGSQEDPVDVILATNMISVGVDIDRLGLMVVMGQPQATSEYIQATSRVGRKYPGLVVVLFNSARSRDRSHYESFTTYHAALYRQVESTSVTPFSARARERALHAVLVTLVRMYETEMRANGDARKAARFSASIDAVRHRILARVKAVAPEELEATEKQLDDLLDVWYRRSAQVADLQYRNFQDTSKALLIDAKYDGPDREAAYPTLWSLRDVDQESALFLVQ